MRWRHPQEGERCGSPRRRARAAPDALLTGFAILVMGFALTLTLSRSGIACFLLAMMLSAFHAGYWLRLGAVTGLVAIAFQEIVEFSLQMPGNAAFFTVLCAIAVRKASVKGARPQQR